MGIDKEVLYSNIWLNLEYQSNIAYYNYLHQELKEKIFQDGSTGRFISQDYYGRRTVVNINSLECTTENLFIEDLMTVSEKDLAIITWNNPFMFGMIKYQTEALITVLINNIEKYFNNLNDHSPAKHDMLRGDFTEFLSLINKNIVLKPSLERKINRMKMVGYDLNINQNN